MSHTLRWLAVYANVLPHYSFSCSWYSDIIFASCVLLEHWFQTRCALELSAVIVTGRVIDECSEQTAYTVFLLFGSPDRIFRYEADNFSHKYTLLRLTQHFIISFSATRLCLCQPYSCIIHKTFKVNMKCHCNNSNIYLDF